MSKEEAFIESMLEHEAWEKPSYGSYGSYSSGYRSRYSGNSYPYQGQLVYTNDDKDCSLCGGPYDPTSPLSMDGMCDDCTKYMYAKGK
ncbi:MAG: hypothetical protein ACYS30_22630 [Planctomycetota bacterium]|jgi:hypothetical protein